MRCLQCGKDLPLLKRLASSEFCSEAHRREYQHEYSQLALGRLMQANPAESQAHPLKKTPLVSPSAQEIVQSPATTTAVNGAPTGGRTESPPTTRAMPAATPNKIAEAPPPVAPPPSEPPTAKAAAVEKPAPAEPQFAPLAAPEFEHAFASLALDKPRHQADVLPLELPHGRVVACESLVEIADSVARSIEHKLDLREMSRPTPRIALDLRIVPPESLEPGKPPLTIPVTLAEPAEASPWIGPHWDFAGELVSLGDFADAQFSKSDFEVPAGEAFAVSAAAVESEPSPQETGAGTAESLTALPTMSGQLPDLLLNPLPVSSAGIAPGRAKPLPVFGPVPAPTGGAQIPQPTGLPLRPLMVLAGPAAPTAEVERRKGDVLSLHSALQIKPELQQTKTSAALSAELNLGLPELRQTPDGPIASRIRKILGGLTGAMLLGIFLETQPHVPVPMGRVNKIRLEAAGNRISHGGAGLYSEGSEQSALHGDFLVTPLSKEK